MGLRKISRQMQAVTGQMMAAGHDWRVTNGLEQVNEGEELVGPDEESVIPYGPDFTAETLGKVIGKDKVLGWLLAEADRLKLRDQLQESIGSACLGHIDARANRRDMASHVVQALGNYDLIDVQDDDTVTLTKVGRLLLATTGSARDDEFARHILSSCGGLRLVEAIQAFELSNQAPTMEALNDRLGQHPTSKNISTMRHWLARAGVLTDKGGYAVSDARLAELLGPGVRQLIGLSSAEVEFILAARVHVAQTGKKVFDAPDVKLLAESRAPDVRIPSKALGGFVQNLVNAGLLVSPGTTKGKGGARTSASLALKGVELAEEQIRSFLQQSVAGFYLADLKPLRVVLEGLAVGNTDQRGHWGEMLGVHVCLMLGLKVVGWRNRLPVEIDLTAERVAAMSYQRWHIQVKNIEGQLDSDRVDREIGAAAGTGATHLLFLVPRGGVTQPARAEMLAKSKLTHLHILSVHADTLELATPNAIVESLKGQLATLVRIKRLEAGRRELLP